MRPLARVLLKLVCFLALISVTQARDLRQRTDRPELSKDLQQNGELGIQTNLSANATLIAKLKKAQLWRNWYHGSDRYWKELKFDHKKNKRGFENGSIYDLESKEALKREKYISAYYKLKLRYLHQMEAYKPVWKRYFLDAREYYTKLLHNIRSMPYFLDEVKQYYEQEKSYYYVVKEILEKKALLVELSKKYNRDHGKKRFPTYFKWIPQRKKIEIPKPTMLPDYFYAWDSHDYGDHGPVGYVWDPNPTD